MFKKGSSSHSIFKNKCPKCHEGKFFKYGVTFNVKKVITIDERCSKCNFKYMIEPSFFFGAMYVNYGISVALAVAIFIISKVFIGLTIVQSFISVALVSLILTPITIRLSRIIYINIFVSYDKNAIPKNQKANSKALDQ